MKHPQPLEHKGAAVFLQTDIVGHQQLDSTGRVNCTERHQAKSRPCCEVGMLTTQSADMKCVSM